MFNLIFSKTFDKSYTQIVNESKEVEKKVRKALYYLEQNPFYPSLRTHKVNTRNYGERWSSSATGDIRIIWDYDTENRLVIILLDIGKHSGSHKVYK